MLVLAIRSKYLLIKNKVYLKIKFLKFPNKIKAPVLTLSYL